MWETRVRSLGQEDPLEKEMATHSSTLAWKIPWTEEPGRLQSWSRKEPRLSDFAFFLFSLLYVPTLTSIHDYWKTTALVLYGLWIAK